MIGFLEICVPGVPPPEVRHPPYPSNPVSLDLGLGRGGASSGGAPPPLSLHPLYHRHPATHPAVGGMDG